MSSVNVRTYINTPVTLTEREVFPTFNVPCPGRE